MSTAKHADFQALSAFVDGEAPEWADHVAGCPQCRATAAELRALSAKVAAPAEPPAAALREAAIAAALEAAGLDAAAPPALGPASAARHQAQRARFGRRWASGSWALPAIAAVVVAVLGLSGVILSANRSTNENATTFAGPALDSKAESGVAAGAPNVPVGDLGDVPDAATLRARALGVTTSAAARSSSSSGVAADAASPSAATSAAGGGSGGSATLNAAPPAPGAATGGAAAVIAPNAVTARPCEDRARAREPGLGPVTYFATARKGTVPAYVLGFSSGPTFTLLMLAQDGCGELLRSAGP